MKIDFLLELVPQDDLGPMRLPALELLVARGDVLESSTRSLEQALLERFGVPADDSPIGALALLGEGADPGSSYWLRADPVCLQATRTRLLLLPLPEGSLSDSEASALASAIQPHIAAAGHELLACHPQRWYLGCANADSSLRTVSPDAAAGLLTEERLPRGRDGAYWRRLMTEAQMLLHSHPVNEAREASAKLPANGIWLWGGGCARPIGSHPYTEVYSDDPLALGLARTGSCEAQCLPAGMREVLVRAHAESSVLVTVSAHTPGLDPARIDAAWLAPLLGALHDGTLAALEITLIANRRAIARRLRRSNLRRFWRRPKALFDHA